MLVNLCALRNFNSIKVQFKPNRYTTLTENTRFQFHKGSIQTHGKRSRRVNLSVFQFHKGSIQTYVPICMPFRCCNFNSIKVQFKLRAHLHAVPLLQFQFHKGSIQTELIQVNMNGIFISIP